MEKNDFDNMVMDEIAVVAANGNVHAIEYIVNSFKGFIRQKARSFYVSGADSDDLLQEGMIGLLKAIRDYSPEKNASFRTFADLCISRQIFTAIKASKCKKHIPLNSYISLYKEIGDNEGNEHFLVDELKVDEQSSDPMQEILRKEELNDVSKVLTERLSKFELLVLSEYMEGKNYREIAHELNRPAKSVDNALQRIKQKATKALSSGGEIF